MGNVFRILGRDLKRLIKAPAAMKSIASSPLTHGEVIPPRKYMYTGCRNRPFAICTPISRTSGQAYKKAMKSSQTTANPPRL